jgi:hypothetical protein
MIDGYVIRSGSGWLLSIDDGIPQMTSDPVQASRTTCAIAAARAEKLAAIGIDAEVVPYIIVRRTW